MGRVANRRLRPDGRFVGEGEQGHNHQVSPIEERQALAVLPHPLPMQRSVDAGFSQVEPVMQKIHQGRGNTGDQVSVFRLIVRSHRNEITRIFR